MLDLRDRVLGRDVRGDREIDPVEIPSASRELEMDVSVELARVEPVAGRDALGDGSRVARSATFRMLRTFSALVP